MNFLEQFRNVHTFIFDVDGVLTNSELLLTEEGQLLRKMNTRDGFAMKMAVRAGYRMCIITGGQSSGVIERLRGLGIQDIYAGVEDKLETLEEIIALYDLDTAGILYMGDDIPDYDPMRYVGIPCCPKDAVPEIAQVAQYHSPIEGGRGCVRDVIEKVLKLHGHWIPDLAENEDTVPTSDFDGDN